MKPDHERVTKLLTDTVTLLCKNGLTYDQELRIQGLLGITLDGNEIFLVPISECFNVPSSSTASSTTNRETSSENERIRKRSCDDFVDLTRLVETPDVRSSVAISRMAQNPTSVARTGDARPRSTGSAVQSIMHRPATSVAPRAVGSAPQRAVPAPARMQPPPAVPRSSPRGPAAAGGNPPGQPAVRSNLTDQQAMCALESRRRAEQMAMYGSHSGQHLQLQQVHQRGDGLHLQQLQQPTPFTDSIHRLMAACMDECQQVGPHLSQKPPVAGAAAAPVTWMQADQHQQQMNRQQQQQQQQQQMMAAAAAGGLRQPVVMDRHMIPGSSLMQMPGSGVHRQPMLTGPQGMSFSLPQINPAEMGNSMNLSGRWQQTPRLALPAPPAMPDYNSGRYVADPNFIQQQQHQMMLAMQSAEAAISGNRHGPGPPPAKRHAPGPAMSPNTRMPALQLAPGVQSGQVHAGHHYLQRDVSQAIPFSSPHQFPLVDPVPVTTIKQCPSPTHASTRSRARMTVEHIDLCGDDESAADGTNGGFSVPVSSILIQPDDVDLQVAPVHFEPLPPASTDANILNAADEQLPPQDVSLPSDARVREILPQSSDTDAEDDGNADGCNTEAGVEFGEERHTAASHLPSLSACGMSDSGRSTGSDRMDLEESSSVHQDTIQTSSVPGTSGTNAAMSWLTTDSTAGNDTELVRLSADESRAMVELDFYAEIDNPS